MKYLIIGLCVCLFPLGLVAQTRPAESTIVTVNVTNGSGSGTFQTARTLHIWAAPPAVGRVFDKWAGDVDALVDPTSAHTMILMSQTRATVSVTATYRNAPTVVATAEPFNGVTLSYYFPPGPLTGVITLHHGTGGSGANFFQKVEYLSFVQEAAARGYGLIALDSLDRVNKQWDPTISPSNADVQNVQSAFNLLISRGLMTATTPRFAVGMSNGGGFVPKVAYFLSYTAADSYCAQAGNAGSNVPLMWNMAMNDGNENVGQSGNDQALANFGSLSARGVPGSFAQNAPAPLYPDRFSGVSGLTPADSASIYQSIKNAGYLDSQDFLLAPPSTSGVQNAIPPGYSVSSRTAILDLLSASYSEHQFFSDANARTLRFFAAPTAAADLNPRLLNLSTRGQVLGGDDVLIGGIIIQGASSTTKSVVIRAIGPSLTAVGVPNALSDPTLDLYNVNGTLIASNDDWRNGSRASEISSATLAPGDDREAALLQDLAPGAYTAIVRGKNNTTGIALVEAYDIQPTGPARLGNVSTRGRVGTGDNIIIGGLITGGPAPKRVVIRALGPSLAAAGVTGALNDPMLELRDSDGKLLAKTDDWQTSELTQELKASRLAPGDAKEAALIAWLVPGSYTVLVRGQEGTEGVALVEAYELY